MFLLGENKACGPIAWHAYKVKRVVRSTIAAGGLSLLEGVEEAIYLRGVFEELLGIGPGSVPIEAYVDNKSVVDAEQVEHKRLRLDVAAL